METIKRITAEQKVLLDAPLPNEAVKPHPTKNYLSTIKIPYVTERFNDVFGVGGWQTLSEVVENSGKMIVVKVTFLVPEYNIRYECYGGNDNADRGDAYKGAVTDAMTKIGSWLGIGADVFKGKQSQKATQSAKKIVTLDDIHHPTTGPALVKWAYAARNAHGEGFDAGAYLAKHYDVTAEVQRQFNQLVNDYISTIHG